MEMIKIKKASVRANKSFQSYLIIGDDESTSKVTENLLSSLHIKLKPSPDITRLEPEKNSISIDVIRLLRRQIHQKPVSLPRKVVIIKSSDNLTIEAQNALLKIYEEPPSHALIILEAQNSKSILPTLVSRAIIITARGKTSTNTTSFVLKNPLDTLREIQNIKDPCAWLDDQIVSTHQLLITKAYLASSPSSLIKTIEACAQAKSMIKSNVNPKFVLANLIITTQL